MSASRLVRRERGSLLWPRPPAHQCLLPERAPTQIFNRHPEPAHRSPDLKPDTSTPTGEIPEELQALAASANVEPIERYEILLAAWDAASEDERARFLNHIGAHLVPRVVH